MNRSEKKRIAILEGAQEAFKIYGIGDATMDTIAKIAGVSKRTVYNHFESKEILVTYVIGEIWSKSVVDYQADYQPDQDLKSQLLALVINEIKFSQSEELLELTRVGVSHTLFSHDDYAEETNQFFKQETALIRWLKAADNDGRFIDTDIEKAKDHLVALIKGQAFWPQLIRFEKTLSDTETKALAEEIVDLFLTFYQKNKSQLSPSQ